MVKLAAALYTGQSRRSASGAAGLIGEMRPTDNWLVQKQLAIGAASGLLWGVLAASVWAAMYSGLIPAPQEIGLPALIIPALALVPLIVAAGLETMVGRASPSLAEHLAATVVCGLALGLALGWLAMLVRRGAGRAG